MKKDERNKMLQRYTDLLNRVDTLQFILNNVEGYEEGDIHSIIKEANEELSKIKNLKDNKQEYLFNFKGYGGWNSEFAFYEEQAITQAIEKYEGPGKIKSNLIDTKSFRVSTPKDHQHLLTMFY